MLSLANPVVGIFLAALMSAFGAIAACIATWRALVEQDKQTAELRAWTMGGDSFGCYEPFLQRGHRLGFFARSTHHLVTIAKELEALGVDLVVLDQAIDSTTPSGRLLFHVLAAIAEFERDLIRDRVISGLRRAGAGSAPRSASAASRRHHRSTPPCGHGPVAASSRAGSCGSPDGNPACARQYESVRPRAVNDAARAWNGRGAHTAGARESTTRAW